MSSLPGWEWFGATDLDGEHVAVEQTPAGFVVHFYDAGDHVEETAPVDEAGWLQLVASRFDGGRIP